MSIKYSFSANAVVRDPKGRCLLLRRSAASRNNAGRWEFPGGKLDAGENPGEALLREIREETGLDAEIARVIGAGESALPDRRVAYVLFEATTLTTNVKLSSEHDAFEWVDAARLCEHNLCPQFIDFAKEFSRKAQTQEGA